MAADRPSPKRQREAESRALMTRIAEALERLAPPPQAAESLDAGDGFVWHGAEDRLQPVTKISRVELELLKGVERQKGLLLDNTLAFARGRPANNALLWGSRGAGKSSLVKAVHAAVMAAEPGARLALIELHREDLPLLSKLLERLRASERRFLLFCDDLSFDAGEGAYKALKVLLEGGLEGRPENTLFYATSNRRHLISREMIENERSTALNPGEAVEEKVSLSDRFGLWIGFHPQDQETYLAIIDGYVEAFGITFDRDLVRKAALRWSIQRGARSGRVAWQFIQNLIGSQGEGLED
jgi:predicted AAA+ superfamily ATPase